MRFPFTPSHIQLLNLCYPPTSGLLTAGPDYSPSSHELSRLTYYASNHPGKLAKLGAEIEKRVRSDARKAKVGNLRARASLLISLGIFRALATECRRDIALVTPSLIASVDAALAATPMDLEVIARVSTVFIAWTTYTNGELIGTDQDLTRYYLSVLQQFSDLSCRSLEDAETQNRTRIIGLAAISSAFNSEALYNDSRQFKALVLILLKPILVSLFDTDLSTLYEQSSSTVTDSPAPYLAEFRTTPALERRAASIHMHIDGDNGPSAGDVSDACLRALFSLLDHSGGVQLGHIMQSSFENLDLINGWTHLNHCCWYAKKTAEWAQYQYRHVVPTWLIEKLLENQDAATTSALHLALASMVSAVFSASTPLINLSSSDLMSNLLNLLLRRSAISEDDPLIPHLVGCIASLGCHIYYSDQIQDLSAELINRIIMIEVQGVRAGGPIPPGRSRALCNLMTALKELIRVANEHEASAVANTSKPGSPVPRIEIQKPDTLAESTPRRTPVSPDVWQDTLSLICDKDLQVRAEYSRLILFYLSEEISKVGEILDTDGIRRVHKLIDGSMLQAANVNLFLNSGDAGSRFLNALHAYAYILAINTTTGAAPASNILDQPESSEPFGTADNEVHAEPRNSPQRSQSSSGKPRARKASIQRRLTQQPISIPYPSSGWDNDHRNLLAILQSVHQELPIRGLLTGVPMLLHLSNILTKGFDDDCTAPLFRVIAEVWVTIGEAWQYAGLVDFVEKARTSNQPLDSTKALELLSDCTHVQEALGLNKLETYRRLSFSWSPSEALYGFTEKHSSRFESSMHGDSVSPLLRISPALMQIENMSLQSLTKVTRGLGVSDLREALEGRNGMSTSALTRPASVSTYDYNSSTTGGEGMLRLSPTRSRTKARTGNMGNGNGNVRDVLTKLGIGKQNTNLKAPFPNFQKSDN